jgi:hypothetical protein
MLCQNVAHAQSESSCLTQARRDLPRAMICAVVNLFVMARAGVEDLELSLTKERAEAA